MPPDTATANATQDIAARVEANLFDSEAEPLETEDNEVDEDAIELPESDDSDSEDDGSDDLSEMTDEELSLAAYLGLDDDRIIVGEDGSYLFNAIIDGETKQVPLKELAASYQLQGHVNNKSMALETERKQFEEVKGQVAMELQTRIQGVTKLGELAEAELVKEYQSIDWNRLRQEDPANWTALRQEYAERAQKVQQVKQLAIEEAERLQQESAQKFQQQAQEYFQSELKAMIVDNPDWANETVRKEKVGELRGFLTNYGFTDEDALGVNDHRLIRLIKDAHAYRSGLKAAEGKKVVGKTLPKFQKPGSSKVATANLAKARAAKAQKARIKSGGGNLNDVAAALVDRM